MRSFSRRRRIKDCLKLIRKSKARFIPKKRALIKLKLKNHLKIYIFRGGWRCAFSERKSSLKVNVVAC